MKNFYANIIFILSILLSLSLLYLTINTLILARNNLLFNSISISPITGERLSPVIANKDPIEITYRIQSEKNLLKVISAADMIYEYTNSSGDAYCRTIFYNPTTSMSDLQKNKAIVSIASKSPKQLPKLDFLDTLDIPQDFTRSACSISILLNDSLYSNFLFYDNQYIHYRGSENDLMNNSSPILLSNVVVQFTGSSDNQPPDNILGAGRGLLFHSGKIYDIKWEKDKKNPVKLLDEEYKPITFLRGKTWWIIVKDGNSVNYY